METLQIGQFVHTSDGQSPFFLSGHHDGNALFPMIEITTASRHTVAATPDHYLPLVGGGHAAAKHLKVGHKLWVQAENGTAESKITGLRRMLKRGLYNPFTTKGDLFVNGVLASCHSAWFLEDYLPAHAVVKIYNLLFNPLVLAYMLNPSLFHKFHTLMFPRAGSLDEAGLW